MTLVQISDFVFISFFSPIHSLCLMNLIQTVLQTVRQHNFIRKTNANMKKEFQLLLNKAGMIPNRWLLVNLHPRNHCVQFNSE